MQESNIEMQLESAVQIETKFRQLADGLSGMVYQFRMAADGAIHFLFVSSGCRTLFELEPETIQRDSEHFFAAIHPEDRPRFEDGLAQAALMLQPWQWAGRFVLPSQEIRWIQAVASPELQVDESIIWSGQFIDISHHKAIEESLRWSEQRYRSLIRASSQVIWSTDVDGQVTDMPDWRNYTGQTIAEVAGYGWINAVHPEERSQAKQSWLQSIKTKELYRQIYRIRGKDGSYRYFLARGVPIFDGDGNICEWIGICTDIHDRKITEAALRQSETRFRELFERSADAILLLDGEVFIDCNKATVKMLRCVNKQQALQLHPAVLSPPFQPDGQSSFEKFNDMITTAFRQRSHRFEWVHRRADGEDFWVEVVLTVIELEGKPMLHTVWREINDRKTTEIALAKSEARFRTIAATIPGAIFQFIRRNGDWAVDYMSERFYDITGVTAEAIMQDISTFVNCQHPDDLEHYRTTITESIDSLTPWRYEGRLIKPNGEVRWWRGESIPTKNPDNEIVFCGVLYDITDRKAVEQALQQSEAELRQQTQELEQTLQELQRTQAQMIQSEKMSSLGQLVAGVAHEINNPVNFIYGNLNHANNYTQDLLSLIELYQQHHPTPHPAVQTRAEEVDLEFLKEDLPKLLNSMRVGADRIQKIVTSLRIFSRMDEAEMKAVDIHEGIDSTLLILQNRLKAKPDHPEISVSKAYGNLPLVECYVGQLNQVFMNILANAIDALEEFLIPSPKIHIQTQEIGSDWIKISIIDNGPGIPESIQQRIFDPFFTTKPIGKGTGMGMSISYQIVTEKHGGRLLYQLAPDQGSEFVIEIPIHQEHADS